MLKSIVLWVVATLAWMPMLTALETAVPTAIGAGKPRSRGYDPYTLRLTSYYQNQGTTYLVLSNGSIWSTPTATLWLVGDKIALTEDFNGGWILNNDSDHSNTSVQFERLNMAIVPRIRSLENGGGSLTLDDGSSWKINWWQRLWAHMWKWQVGDHILIAPLPLLLSSQSHLLINGDRSLNHTPALLIYR